MIKREVQIGDCRLLLGDCTKIMPLLDKVDAVVTDPPYGMAFQSNHRIEKHRAIKNDDNAELLTWATNLPANHSKYIFCRWDNIADVPKPKSLVTWIKNNHSMGDLNHEHGRLTETILFYSHDSHFFPKGRPCDVIYGYRTGNNFHPTEKPVDLMGQIIKWTDGLVLDPFMGSGTTGVACAKLGRKFIGIELDENYFNIACERIEKAYQQPDLFIEQPKEFKQQSFLEDGQ